MNIMDLLKKISGVKEKDVEEAFEKAVESARGEASGFEAFILVTDNQTAICGTGVELLALVTTVISDLAEKGLPIEEAHRAVDVAYMSDEELDEEVEKSRKQREKNLKEVKNILESLKEKIEKENDDE